jgi:hypothetical protein
MTGYSGRGRKATENRWEADEMALIFDKLRDEKRIGM